MIALTAIALLACGLVGAGFAAIGGLFALLSIMAFLFNLVESVETWSWRGGWGEAGRFLAVAVASIPFAVGLLYIVYRYGATVTKWAAS